MSPRLLARVLGVWAAATALACALVHHAFAMRETPGAPVAVIASVWRAGKVEARAVLSRVGERTPALDAALASGPGGTLVYEPVTGVGPVLRLSELALAMSFVPGRDGVAATLGGRTEYLTPDDLLALQAYDRDFQFAASVGLSIGLDVPLIAATLGDRLGATASEVLRAGKLSRIRTQRVVPGARDAPVVTADNLTRQEALDGAVAAARYLARGVDAQGRFRYMVDAPTNRTLPGYDWPRHAGATLFLAQTAALSHDGNLAWATARAASFLRDHATLACGEHHCIGDGAMVDVGSTALAVMAFAEIARSGLDAGYALAIPELTAFLRAQQRPDGEFMHEYDRQTSQPIDVQLVYYSGEAILALSRAHTLLHDARDLDAASRGLAHVVGPAWSFFGDRYYFGEEHWTCQAMSDLWDRVPMPGALDFCLRWQAYNRRLQYGVDDTPYDADGAYGFGPLVTPRLTPTGSKAEAGIATLVAATRAGVPEEQRAVLTSQMRRTLAVLLRHQLGHSRGAPGMRYLLADPAAMDGALPASEVDWQVRIDYAQHTGCALLRWAALEDQP